jgi:methylenetetrahydrofolate reductase (NADPH)
MAEMSGAKLPEELFGALNSAKDDEQAREIGMAFSIELGRQLISRGAPGLHIFTLNHHRAATELLEGIGLR